MRRDRTPDPETPMGGTPEPTAQPETAGDHDNPVYDAGLTKEEIVLLATLGIRNPTTGAIASIKVVAGVLARMMQKIREQAIEATHEDRDSIELSRNAKEEYAWKIKVYMDAMGNPLAGLTMIDKINRRMLAQYIHPTEVRKK